MARYEMGGGAGCRDREDKGAGGLVRTKEMESLLFGMTSPLLALHLSVCHSLCLTLSISSLSFPVLFPAMSCLWLPHPHCVCESPPPPLSQSVSLSFPLSVSPCRLLFSQQATIYL